MAATAPRPDERRRRSTETSAARPCRSCLWRKYSDEAKFEGAGLKMRERRIRVGRQSCDRLEPVALQSPAARHLPGGSAVKPRKRRPIVAAGRAERVERLDRLNRSAVER